MKCISSFTVHSDHMIFKHSINLFLLFTLSFFGLPQSNVFGQKDHFNISSLTTEDGLSNNHVTAVLEDSKGFVWIATYDGLNRWNGYEFEIFKKENDNPNSLPGNFIISLAEDQSKNIWIGTNNSGLVKYDVSEEKFYRYSTIPGDENSIPGNIIRYIEVDTQNQIWIGTNYGLAKYDPEQDTFKRFRFPKGMSLESTVDVRRIAQINEEELLIQNNQGLFTLNTFNEIIQKVGYDVPFYNERLFTQNEPFLLDSYSNLWIGTVEGLIRYNTKTGEFKKYKNDETDKNSISSITFSVIFEDSRRNVWIGTSNRGVNKYNRENDDFTVIQEDFKSRNSLTNNIITNIYEDSNSNIWFSTQEGGVNYFNYKSRKFEYFIHNHLDKSSVSSNKIGSFHEDAKGNIWIGTKDGGLNKFLKDKKVFERNYVSTAFISPSILAMEDQSDDELYITGWETGLYSFNTSNGVSTNLMKEVEIDKKPLPINIKGMTLDSNNNLWLAVHEKNGIMVYDVDAKKFYTANNPGPFDPTLLNTEYAVSIIEDSKKRLWVVSYVGIFMFDSVLHDFRQIPDDSNTISSNYAFDLMEDSKGNIWVGSSGGLDKITELDGEFNVERLNDKYPLPKNIKGILEDESGNLWLSSHQEITKLNPETGEIKQYNINNDMPNQEFYERSRLKSSNGEMYFGGINGFLKFHPDSVRENDIEPKVHIIDFQIFNESQVVNGENSPLLKAITETDEINLSYNQSVLTFEFVGLNFNPYQKLEYAYKMEGFDDQWYFVGQKRFATYTNLPPGNYTFHVRLAEGTNIQEAGTSLLLNISPPIWMTKWAYAAYFILIALIFYFFRKSILFREQLRNELKLEKLEIKNVMETNLMKLRFFTNVSHEFRTPLTLIKAPIEKLVRTAGQLDREEQRYHFELIASNTNKLLSLVDQLMDYRKLEAGSLVLEPSQGDIVEFCRKVWSIFNVLAEKSNITYEFHTEIKSHMMAFDADKLDKIISNLLSNAFKNTNEEGHISLRIEREYTDKEALSGFINIIVKDDGVGIPTKDLPRIFQRFYSVRRRENNEVKGTGIGLALSKELAELHKGEITVVSKKDEGATFKLMLPFGIKDIDGSLIELAKEVKSEKVDKQIETKIFGFKKSDKEKILIVEDDDELRLFLEKEMGNSFNVIQAKDGKDGLSKAYIDVPDIIISDVTMPNMDGFEFCQSIKADDRTSHIPLILLTARHAQEKQLEGFEAGADDYIIKPFNVEILKSRINNLLTSRNELVNKFKNSTGLVFSSKSGEDKDENLIQTIIDIVLENIEVEKINADFIAERVNMSRSLVYLKIEALTGQSVNEFIRTIRLKKSIQLLKSDTKNITEVAYSVGFSSQSYFTRSFIKQFGLSPKEFSNKQKVH